MNSMSIPLRKDLEVESEPIAAQASDIDTLLDAVRPAMEADGGGVDVVGVEDGVVKVRLKGTCLACPSAGMTMKFGIERALREQFGWIRDVVRVT